MQPSFNITVAEPCHEDWNKMSPVEQGRFCGSCQKNVIDFTTKSDEEIIAFFNNYNGSSCGRFANEQLNRPIQHIELKPASRFIHYAASLLLPTALFATKSKAQTVSETKKDTTENVSFDPDMVVTVGTFMKAPEVKEFVQGKIVDAETKEPLAGVSVTLKGSDRGVVTDDNGEFTLAFTSRKDVLQYSSVGYQTAEIKLSKLSTKNELVLQMKQTPMLMGEVIVTGYATRTMGKVVCTTSVKKTTYTFWNRIKDTLLPTAVQVYPNPVAATGTVQLSFPNVKPGTYQIRLLNNSGQLFYSFQKQISGKNETEQIHLSNLMAAGIYLVQVTDEKNKMIQNSKLIIQ